MARGRSRVNTPSSEASVTVIVLNDAIERVVLQLDGLIVRVVDQAILNRDASCQVCSRSRRTNVDTLAVETTDASDVVNVAVLYRAVCALISKTNRFLVGVANFAQVNGEVRAVIEEKSLVDVVNVPPVDRDLGRLVQTHSIANATVAKPWLMPWESTQCDRSNEPGRCGSSVCSLLEEHRIANCDGRQRLRQRQPGTRFRPVIRVRSARVLVVDKEVPSRRRVCDPYNLGGIGHISYLKKKPSRRCYLDGSADSLHL